MARKRMLDPSFWDDPQLGMLSDSTRLLFLSMLSNADDEGRGDADIAFLRKIAWGLKENPPAFADVENMLLELDQTLRSLVLYEVDGRRYYYLSNFRHGKRYQTINRPSTSLIPAPPSMAPDPEESAPDQPNIFQVYEQEIGPLTPMIANSLQDDEEEFTFNWVVEAIKEASGHNARNYKYIQAILKNWKAHGYKAGKKKEEAKPEAYSKEELEAKVKKGSK